MTVDQLEQRRRFFFNAVSEKGKKVHIRVLSVTILGWDGQNVNPQLGDSNSRLVKAEMQTCLQEKDNYLKAAIYHKVDQVLTLSFFILKQHIFIQICGNITCLYLCWLIVECLGKIL